MSKPNTKTAMQLLITQIQKSIPLDLNAAQICQGECLGCSKKMLEMLDAELSYWQCSPHVPGLKDLKNLEKISIRTYKIMKRNKLIT